MLRTRLWMGAILIALTVGMLVGDQHLAPWFPFLFAFVVGLSVVACRELVVLLGPARAPQVALCCVGVLALALANWLVPYLNPRASLWQVLPAILAGLVLAVFLYEMARFTGPSRSVERMAVTVWAIAYLGLLPCFF